MMKNKVLIEFKLNDDELGKNYFDVDILRMYLKFIFKKYIILDIFKDNHDSKIRIITNKFTQNLLNYINLNRTRISG